MVPQPRRRRAGKQGLATCVEQSPSRQEAVVMRSVCSVMGLVEVLNGAAQAWASPAIGGSWWPRLPPNFYVSSELLQGKVAWIQVIVLGPIQDARLER